MKLLLIILLSALTCQAQSYNFQLVPDPSVCGPTNCGPASGSGLFTVGTPFTLDRFTVYPIIGLSGTLNGAAMSMLSGGLYYAPVNQLPATAVLQFGSAGTTWSTPLNVSQCPACGQSLFGNNHHTPVLVLTQTMPAFTSRGPALPGTNAPTVFLRPNPAAQNNARARDVALAIAIPIAARLALMGIDKLRSRGKLNAQPSGHARHLLREILIG